MMKLVTRKVAGKGKKTTQVIVLSKKDYFALRKIPKIAQWEDEIEVEEDKDLSPDEEINFDYGGLDINEYDKGGKTAVDDVYESLVTLQESIDDNVPIIDRGLAEDIAEATGRSVDEVFNKVVPPALVDRIKAFLSDKLRRAHNPFRG